MGRWMSPDWNAEPVPIPYADIGDPQSLNLYGYVKNNPLSMADPDGHETCCDVLPTMAEVDAGIAYLGAAAATGAEFTISALAAPVVAIGGFVLSPAQAGNDPAERRYLLMMSKGGNRNVKHTQFDDYTDEELEAITRDPNAPSALKQKAIATLKGRRQRNQQKRGGGNNGGNGGRGGNNNNAGNNNNNNPNRGGMGLVPFLKTCPPSASSAPERQTWRAKLGAYMRHKADEGQATRANVVTRIRAVSSLPVEDKGRLAETLSRYLADRSPRVRAAALEVVRDESLREVEQQVITLLSDRSSFVRYSAVECLGALHEEESIGASWLYPLLTDPVALVRIEALESLARIGDKGSLSLIVERLHDDDAMVRAYAARSIALLNGREYITNVASASMSEQDDNAKAGFAESLFRLGDDDQFAVLLRLLSSSEYLARCASANALSDLPLDQTQLRSALEAVSHAAQNALVRGDRSTMERVEKELRER